MRTVTFADLDLVGYLKEHFVLAWHNQSPDVYAVPGQQERYTAEQVKAYPEGGGGGNVRSYFCTPDGQVLAYVEGYWTGPRFLAEAKFAQGLAARVGRLAPAGRAAEVAAALDERRRQIAAERQALREQHPDEFKKKVFESEVRKREAALGLLEKTYVTSAELTAKPVSPVLASLRRLNLERGVIK
jgi:hypothetical protein